MSLDALKDPFAADCPSFLEQVLAPPCVLDGASLVTTSEPSSPPTEEPEQPQKRGPGRPGKKRKRVEEQGSKKPSLQREVAYCGMFSHRGSYLCLGSLGSGRVVIWDMVTRNPVAVFKCHDGTVTSVAYLPRGKAKLLMTTGTDGMVKVWDLDGFKCLFQATFPLPVVGASVPQNFDGKGVVQCLVSFSLDSKAPSQAEGDLWPLIFDLELPSPNMESPVVRELSSLKNRRILKCKSAQEKPPPSPKVIVSTFDRTGTYVYVGGHNAIIHQFDAMSGKEINSFQPISRKGWVQYLAFSTSGKQLLVQVTDKVIHLLEVEKDALVHKHDFQDSVEGTKWSSCIISPDGEYIIGGCSKTHTLHVWNVLGRHMAKLPSSTHGLVRDLLWHPSRPLVVSLGRDGQVFLWSTHRSESWSAFAPNFIQLEENIEYHEKEDEFDKNKTGQPQLQTMLSADIEVDVLAVDKSEEDCIEEFYLPFVPENSDRIVF